MAITAWSAKVCNNSTSLEIRSSFDYLVGDGEHTGRHLDAERLRSLEVDH
jgi:2-keto-3-deoxy-L-rhamnonate aldolase RhmA